MRSVMPSESLNGKAMIQQMQGGALRDFTGAFC